MYLYLAVFVCVYTGVKVAAIVLAVCEHWHFLRVSVCLAARSDVVLVFRQTEKATAACGLRAGDSRLCSPSLFFSLTHTLWVMAK